MDPSSAACYQSLIPAISGGARAIGGGGVRVLVYACSRGPEWYSGVGGDGRRTTTSRRLSLVASGDLAARLSGDGHRGTQDCLDFRPDCPVTGLGLGLTFLWFLP